MENPTETLSLTEDRSSALAVASGSPFLVFEMNDCDWQVARSLEEVAAHRETKRKLILLSNWKERGDSDDFEIISKADLTRLAAMSATADNQKGGGA